MAIVKFLGRVIPDRGLNITQIPTHTLKYPSGFEATLETTVENSAVTVECEVERFDHAIFEPLHLHVLQITRPSVVDLVSFESGSGFTTRPREIYRAGWHNRYDSVGRPHAQRNLLYSRPTSLRNQRRLASFHDSSLANVDARTTLSLAD